MNNARTLHGPLVLGEPMCSAESRSERKMSHHMHFADLHAASDGPSIQTSLCPDSWWLISLNLTCLKWNTSLMDNTAVLSYKGLVLRPISYGFHP